MELGGPTDVQSEMVDDPKLLTGDRSQMRFDLAARRHMTLSRCVLEQAFWLSYVFLRKF